MRKLGIAAKIYLAFGSIFLLAVVASSIGWRGFERVTESQNSVIDQAIPGLRQAHRLSALNTSIGAASAQLLRVHNESERLEISADLFAKVDQMNVLIDDFQQKEFSPGSLQSLRAIVGEIEQRLRQQDDLVRQRIQQEAHFTGLAASLIATTVALNELADSLVANAAASTTAITSNLYDMVEDNADKRQLYEVFDRLVEVDLDAMERMYELRLRSANLSALFNQVAKESDLDQLGQLRRHTAETLSILKRRVTEINDPQRRDQATRLLVAMEVDNGPLYVYGIFESRISLLQTENSLTRLSVDMAAASQALNGIVNELNATGGTLINRVSTTAKESLDNSRRLFGGTSIVLLLAAAAILWWFIKRNVVRRLLSLQSATHAITEGDYDVDIIVEGHDELTDMGKALQGFRDNAIRSRKLDEELREHKVHLEELVEERSEQLQKTNQMLSEEVQNHALAREKAEQANQAKTTFLATMSHELRTPLSGALGTLRLLSETELQSLQLDYVRIINAANASLLDIVNDILGYSQVEAGKLNIENRHFDLAELLNNVIGLMMVSVQEKNNNLQLQQELRGGRWFIGDSGRLHQILINLIGNANKFTDNGEIVLQVEALENGSPGSMVLRFSVTDTGIGIAEDRQEDVFKAFTQVDTSSARRYGGIGLGLAICEGLVNAMGGSISLQSELGAGTRIGFDVQLETCDAIDPEGFVNPITSRHEAANVLMVEDDATNSLVTSKYLQHLGHRVIVAETGEQALKLVDKGGMALVLLDISLPGIDGLTILEYIRTHADTAVSGIPVIAMSAHVFREEVDQYLSAGMNGFLGKPFSLEDLDLAISQALDGNEVTNAHGGHRQGRQDMKLIDNTMIDDDIKRLGMENVEQLASLFYRSAGQLKTELLDALNSGDPEKQEKLSHKLNGAAANFGLEKLCALLGRIEAEARQGVTATPASAQQVEVAYNAAIAALEACISEQKKHQPLDFPESRSGT